MMRKICIAVKYKKKVNICNGCIRYAPNNATPKEIPPKALAYQKQGGGHGDNACIPTERKNTRSRQQHSNTPYTLQGGQIKVPEDQSTLKKKSPKIRDPWPPKQKAPIMMQKRGYS